MAFKRGKLGIVLGIFQLLFLVLFALFVTYDDGANASAEANQKEPAQGGANPRDNDVKHFYPTFDFHRALFQDVHVMIFIGFGFLMTFLKRYGFGAVSLNFLVASFVLQWAILMGGFLRMDGGKIALNITSMLSADFAAAAVLISYGAVLGKASPLQLIVMAFIEIVCFAGNEFIGTHFFKAVDMGGSMFVHTFGAYFGLAIARILYRSDTEESTKEGSVYHSDLFSMIGTVFLWIYWPSFNAALAPGDDQHRAVINTYLALASCCVTTFMFSSFLDNKGKFDMVHVQNATLAGGVAIGTSADMMVHPWGALLVGVVAGAVSVIGFKYITPFLAERVGVHDTCGVNNLHGMPGIMAGIIGAIVTACANEDTYGYSLYEIYPARAPSEGNSTALQQIQAALPEVSPGDGRSAGTQAGYQAAALALTLGFALVTGAITGLFLKLSCFDQPKGKKIFDDGPWFQTPDDFKEERFVLNGRKSELLRKDEEDAKV